ncbi:hypothetical protein [Kutzneria kofuensis]|uniref:Uncharacterized protein n=1 Tax=Kutzneria kofuensis TaxID=103725 RepID=A0A7W9NEW1_9PSEU|nr:hypothetical protein [Kutzneria kofuensis]MBB5889854.1 hypothetical protein [Kutzneria kofuensis]
MCAVELVLAVLGVFPDIVMAVRDWPGRSTRSAGAHTGRRPAGAPAGRLDLAHPEGVGSVHRRRMKHVRHHP